MGMRAAAGGTVKGTDADDAGSALFPEREEEERGRRLVIDHFISTHTHTHTHSCKCNC